jgi:hypothetical protein
LEKADINLEFAHVEFKSRFDKEQVLASVRIAQDLLTRFNNEGLTCSISILIDDKHAEHRLTIGDVAPFLAFLSQHITRIDYICYESRLTDYKEEMFSFLIEEHRDRIRQKVLDYEAKHGKIACSQDIAIWHLMRLGYILGDANTIVPVGALMRGSQLPPFQAQRLISILGENDREPEEIAKADILRFSRDGSVLSRIERIYFHPVTGNAIN